MRLVLVAALVTTLIAACLPSRTGSSSPPFPYTRELGALVEAIEDLEHADVGDSKMKDTSAKLATAFKHVCNGYRVPCERDKWAPPWANRGDVGKILTHALTSLDRVYMKWNRARDYQNHNAVVTIDEARRSVRELLFAYEHRGPTPAHRSLLMGTAELRYVRSLLGDELPPTDTPWDADATRAALDESIATIESSWPDHAKHVAIDVADFANYQYLERLMIAYDVMERALDDIVHDDARREEKHGGPLAQIMLELRHAQNAVSLGFGKPAPRVRENPTVLHDAFESLVIARTVLESPNTNEERIVRPSRAAELSIKEAFLSATNALGLPSDEKIWLPRKLPGFFNPLQMVQVADAEFALRPELAGARKQLALALTALTQLAASQSIWKDEGKLFEPLEKQLSLAQSFLAVQPPDGFSWDPRPAVANMRSAIAEIRAKYSWSTTPTRFGGTVPSQLPYHVRLIVAHDGIQRALRDVHRLPKAPRGVLVKARAVVDALEEVLNQRRVVATQR